jgi:hypothetical protein
MAVRPTRPALVLDVFFSLLVEQVSLLFFGEASFMSRRQSVQLFFRPSVAVRPNPSLKRGSNVRLLLPMTHENGFLTLDDVLNARRALQVLVRRSIWRVLTRSIAWGATTALAFILATWLWGYVETIRTARIYWLVGAFSFVFFGSWPVIDFVRGALAHRDVLASLESRVRAGEHISRPNSSLQPTALGRG